MILYKRFRIAIVTIPQRTDIVRFLVLKATTNTGMEAKINGFLTLRKIAPSGARTLSIRSEERIATGTSFNQSSRYLGRSTREKATVDNMRGR